MREVKFYSAKNSSHWLSCLLRCLNSSSCWKLDLRPCDSRLSSETSYKHMGGVKAPQGLNEILTIPFFFCENRFQVIHMLKLSDSSSSVFDSSPWCSWDAKIFVACLSVLLRRSRVAVTKTWQKADRCGVSQHWIENIFDCTKSAKYRTKAADCN